MECWDSKMVRIATDRPGPAVPILRPPRRRGRPPGRSAAEEKSAVGSLDATSLGTPQPDADRGSKSEGTDQGHPLAAAIANLSPADRARLAAMLTGKE